MQRRQSVAFRTSLLVNLCAGVLVLGVALLGVSVVSTGRAVETLSGSLTSRVMAHVEARLHGFFEPVIMALEIVAERVNDGVFDQLPVAEMDRFYVPLVEGVPQLSSLMHAYGDGREFMLLARDDGGRLSRVTDPDGRPGVALVRSWMGEPEGAVVVQEQLEYDARGRPWYTGAMARLEQVGPEASIRERIHWTSPYRFFTTQEPGITASVAVPTSTGKVVVLGFDILLSAISRFTIDLTMGSRGKVFVMRGDPAQPQDIALIGLPDHPDASDPASIARLVLSTPAQLGGPVADLLAGPNARDGVARPFESGGARWWGALQPSDLRVSEDIWLGALIPEGELLEGLPDVRTWIALGTGLVVLMAFLRARRLARLYGSPLADLAHQGERMERLDFQARGRTESSITEIRQLGSTLDSMRESLARFSAEREDLRVARSVRRAHAPDPGAAPPGWSLACWHAPCDEVEGEVLDVIPGEAGALHLALFDLPGMGVQAAVDGAAARAALRTLVAQGGQPVELVAGLQRFATEELGLGAPRGWVARLDVASGQLQAAGLGGEDLCLRRADGRVELLPGGAAPGEVSEAGEASLTLQPGEALLLASDGVTRALNEQRRRFGSAGVARVLEVAPAGDPEAPLAALREALEDFACDTPRDRSALVLMRDVASAN